MENLIDAMYGAIPGVITVLTTGLVGAALTFLWNLQLKRRELALASAKRFHELYGEFFALWKLWNYYVRDVEPGSFPTASRWNMLERACAAESGIEATLVELCTRRRLTTADIEDLGQFRQIYQTLRESIRDNRPIDWDWSDHDRYQIFKRLAPRIAHLIRAGRLTRKNKSKKAEEEWVAITSNKFENFLDSQEGTLTRNTANHFSGEE